MDNQNTNGLPQDDSWLDELLTSPELGDELGPDESAVTSAGLTHPDDAELERIIQETKVVGWDEALASALGAPLEDIPQEGPSIPETVPFQDEEYRDTFGDGEALASLFGGETPPPGEVPEAPEEEDEPAPPVRKGRPRRKKGYGLLGLPHLLASLVWVFIAVLIGLSLGRLLWVCTEDMMAFGRQEKEVVVTITDRDDLDDIAQKLKDAGLIKYPGFFKLFVGIKGDEEELSAGTFTLNTIYDYNALVNSIKPHSPAREEVEIMIPEGYTAAQIFAKLEEEGVCSAAKLEEYSASGELNDYWLLEGVERGSRYCLEGYLFPDTYRFYTNDDPRHVLQKFLNAFDARFTDIMKERLITINERFSQMLSNNGYSQEYIDEHQIGLREVVIIASIVEKEAANSKESYTVASVFYNRLADQKNYPYLQSDATVYYAIGGASSKELTAEDIQIDSPYNSYVYPGLIPGPISNPGQGSLNAALDPDDTGYYFFFYDEDAGISRFAKTYKEHLANVDKYGG